MEMESTLQAYSSLKLLVQKVQTTTKNKTKELDVNATTCLKSKSCILVTLQKGSRRKFWPFRHSDMKITLTGKVVVN